MFCHAMPRAALFRRVSIRVRTAPASIPSPPLAAPSPPPRPPGRRLSQRAYHASPRVTPALPCAQGRRAVVAGGRAGGGRRGFRSPGHHLPPPAPSAYIAASDGPRTCHEMSCSVMRCHVFPPPRPSPTASPKRRMSPSCMSSLHRVSLRSRRRRLACGATLFRAYRAGARARVRAGAVRAPDCAREPCAGRTSPVRSVGGFSRRCKAGDEAASGCRFLLSHLTTDL